ncbi:Lysophospholipase, alpha-beta hydrolase superfamily [Nitrosomonas aestuarii]|uniref:Lysophospholipase, alpha-beta hydrolase superfamily n=1 Tax=Nitrosomonas aestuarii TaxID=52441 RepID=A0A1I3Y735_9PROT|nr:alpha/beta hydrolase [Nitrosomonas aestuarii]SFK27583.1 Lysophospholipase, alpha-beta hydrolase superfamily [Nitrosomonas aestuarii]
MTTPYCKFKIADFKFILPLLILLSGCMHQQYVSEPYPRWGEEYSIPRSGDNPPLILRVLSPLESASPVACILLVHGMNEYIGRYGDVARHFSNQFLVAGFDYYAHGLSNPVLQQAEKALNSGVGRQDVSQAYLAQVLLYDLELMRRDLDYALKKTIQICDAQVGSKKPVFLISHSLGSLITASYLLQMQDKEEESLIRRVQGVILQAPGFAVSEPPGWRGWLAGPLIKLSFHAETHFLNPQNDSLPLLVFNQMLSLVTVPVLDGLFEVFSWPGLRYFFTPTTPEWVVDYLTDSEKERSRLQTDGWIIRRSLLRYIKGIESEIVQFRRHMDDFATAYYLIYSAHDPITAAWGNEDFVNATLNNHQDNAYLALPELRYHQHLFLTKPRRNAIIKNIEQWLDRRLAAMKHAETEMQ